MTIRATILDEMGRIAQRQGKRLAPLHDTLVLVESGFDSLCMAILIASLDDCLGVDPLDPAKGGPMPVTVGDLVALYQHAAA